MINREMLNRNCKRWIAVFCATTLIAGSAYALGANGSQPVESKVKSTTVESSVSADEQLTSKDETVYVICDANGNKNQVIVSDHLKNVLNDTALMDQSSLSGIYNTNSDAGFTTGADGSIEWAADGEDIYYSGTTEASLPVDIKITYTLDGKEISPSELAGKSGKVTMRFNYENKQYETVKINGTDTKIYVPFLVASGMILDNETFKNIEITNGKLVDDGSRTVVVGIALPGLNENLGIDTIDTSKFSTIDEIKLPDYVEVTADVTNFSLGLTMSVATNELFNNVDLSGLDLDDANAMVEELTAGITQIVDRSGSLYNGLDSLLTKASALTDGIDALAQGGDKLASGSKDLADGANTLYNGSKELADGASKVNDGAASLSGGAALVNSGAASLADGASKANAGANALTSGSKQLADGSKELASGLDQLSQNSANLNAGALQVFNTLLNTAYTQITASGLSIDKLTVDNYGKVLENAINNLDSDKVYAAAKAQVTQKVEAMGDQLYVAYINNNEDAIIYQYAQGNEAVIASLTAEQKAAIKAGAVAALTAEQKAAIKQGAIDQTMASAEVQAKLSAASEGVKTLSSLKASLDTYKQFYTGVLTYTAGVDSAAAGANTLSSGANTLYSGAKDLSTGLNTLTEGANTLAAGTSTLESGAGSLKDGTSSLKDGANTLSNGAGSLADGANTLSNGATTLSEGINKLKDSVPALIEGITALRNGSKELYDGLNKVYTEGVKGLVELYDGDVKNLVERLNATVEVSKNYKSFSGINDNMEGTVRFVYRTEAIEAPEETK